MSDPEIKSPELSSIEADVDTVMKKYDRESNVRIWEGRPAVLVRWLSAFFSLYCIYVTLFSTAMPEIRLNIFLGLILILGYLHYPIRKSTGEVKPGISDSISIPITFDTTPRVNSIPFYDILIMLIGVVPFFYFAWNAESIIKLALRVTSPRNPDHILMITLALIGILSLMELCRRCVGIPILCVVGALMVYAFSTVRFGKVIYDLFYSTGDGLRSTPIEVCAKYIVVFIIFGAFLERTGISTFFINLANAIAGASAGGPAKVAVISSALCGMVSGSSVGNTVTTGSVTIPMMKRTGYRPEFAGAVEAAASTGGQIMPPIMGAAAFLMAEYMGIPYSSVALKAILPAVLYFAGIYIAVHLEAKKLGLKGIPREELPRIIKLLPKIYLLLPLIILVVMVSMNIYTMQFSAAIAIGLAILVGFLNSDERLTPRKILEALEAGGRGTITVAVACAMAGLVAGCITSTGLASELITVVVNVSGGHSFIALILTMICCIILGMGVPTTANYCIMAATCAPILMAPAIGIPKICAHFFVFYFGIVADITPPVALAAYAGSAIAKAPPMKTAFNATRLAIAAFIVPYIFAFTPAMLFENVSPIINIPNAGPLLVNFLIVLEIIMICLTALLGIFGVAAALNGYLYGTIHPLLRILICAGGLSMLVPGVSTDLIGFALVALVVAFQYMNRKK
ncbi:MAG: TRAP transporter fused permease subunit [Synergistaceae bacterium]|nr:TRAP transporter fused permease subunit [Synergistaceae bacterium]